MKVQICQSKTAAAAQAAAEGAKRIRQAIREQGQANIIVATGASQLDMLKSLVATEDIAWNKVTAFHLDEYIGLPLNHPASFRQYLWQRFVSKLPLPLAGFHYVDGETDPQVECKRLGEILAKYPINVAFVGIGQNGHLAFNDPPADFDVEDPYLVVSLDEACRRQQMEEGWFASCQEVPQRAISMSIKQIMKSQFIVCTVPDKRKAEAVKAAVEGPVTPEVPASILQVHGQVTIYLDRESASLLEAG